MPISISNSGTPFTLNASFRRGGYITILNVEGETGPDRDSLVLELIGDNAPTGAIATWPDTSGLGNNATQATGGSQPTGTATALNGHKIVTADGADDFLSVGTFSSPATQYLVAKWNAPNGGFQMMTSANGGFELRLNPATAAQIHLMAYNTGVDAPASDGTQWNLITAVSSASGTDLYINGAFIGNVPEEAAVSLATLTLFGRGAGFFTAGSIADLRLFSVKHDTDTRQAWEAYIGGLYGLTIAH